MGRSPFSCQEEMGGPGVLQYHSRHPGDLGNLGFNSWPYLNLVNGFLIFFLPGFEEGLGIFNHLL